MSAVETQLKDASVNLLHLIVMLVNAVKIDSRTTLEPKRDEYYHSFCAPAVCHTIQSDFDTKNEQGKFLTPEGVLKHKVLSSVSLRL